MSKSGLLRPMLLVTGLWTVLLAALGASDVAGHLDAPPGYEPLLGDLSRDLASLAVAWVCGMMGSTWSFRWINAGRMQREQAFAALADTERRFRRIFENSPVPYVALDAAGRILDVNRAFQDVLGHSAPDVVGRSIAELADPSRRDAMAHCLADLLREGSLPANECHLRHAHGHELTFLAEGRAGQDERGVFERAHLFLHDMTERRRAEEALRRSEARLVQAQRLARLGVWEWDPVSDVTTWSDEMLRIYGVSREQFTGRGQDYLAFTHPDDRRLQEATIRRNLTAATEQAHASGTAVDARPEPREFRIVRPDGAVRWVRGDTLEEVDHQGKPVRMLGILWDITEQKTAEMQRRASESRFTAFMEALTAHAFIKDADGRFVYANPGLAAVLGADQRWRGRTVDELLPDVDRAAVQRAETRVLQEGGPVVVEEKLSLPGGAHHLLVTRFPVHEPGGPPLVGGIAMDVTGLKEAEARAASERARARDYFENVPVIMLVLDDRGCVLEVNRNGCEVLGGTREQVVGLDWVDTFIPPEQRASARSVFQSVMGGNAQLLGYTESEVLRLDGTRRLVGWHNNVVRRERGEVVGTLSAGEDITLRRRLEDRLQTFSRAVEQSPVSIIITNTSADIEYVNPRFTALTGYSADEVLGKNPRILQAPDQPREHFKAMWDCLAAGREWKGELHNRRKDGREFWESAVISPIVDLEGRVTHYLAVKEDVTERRAAEEQLRKQATLLEVTGDAIAVLGMDRGIRYWNHGAERLYGFKRDDVLGRAYDPLVGKAAPGSGDTWWRAVTEQGSWNGELTQVTLGGHEVVVRLRATPLPGTDGRPDEVLVVATDVTEAKRLEKQLLRSQRMESLGALAAGVAHDINNMLTPILLGVGALTGPESAPEDRALVDMMTGCAQRASNVVKQLLLFGRGSESPRAPVDVRHLLREVGVMLRETFPRNIRVALDLPPGLWPVSGDVTELHQVLLNLCVNARDALAAGGELRVTAENLVLDDQYASQVPDAVPGPHLVLTVSDTGSGILPEHMDRVFDPFFTTKPVGRGSGLGLPTVLGIVRGHGGFVDLRSVPGRGTDVRVFLPALLGPAPALAPDNGRAPPGRGETILLVDDEDAIRRLVERLLASRNYRVIVAEDGTAALRQFSRTGTRVSAVITDLMMPVLDGMNLVQALRAMAPDLPVIGFSGFHQEARNFERAAGPRSRFLSKPFPSETLLKTLRELLDSELTSQLN